MSTLYRRGSIYWVGWYEKGHRFAKSTGVSDEVRARETQRVIDREAKARAALPLPRTAAKTVGTYRRLWIEDRRKHGKSTADDDNTRLGHARALDSMRLDEVRPRHIREVILRLRQEGRHAPRTIRHVYGVLHTMFEDAFSDELVLANPCKLKRGDLPPKQDANPAWRATAIYTRQEVQALISSPKIPPDRRVLYALLFLTGCRIGEVSDRRWRDYDAERRPLGSLHVHSSWHTKRKESKSTKTGAAPQVPVHPALAVALKWWHSEGFKKMLGREPGQDDLLIPTMANKPRTSNHVRNKLLADLVRLGFRARRTHDTRRTFISLALADGARGDILQWVTHAPKTGAFSLYQSIPWPALCAEVKRLKIRSPKPATFSLHTSAHAGRKAVPSNG